MRVWANAVAPRYGRLVKSAAIPVSAISHHTPAVSNGARCSSSNSRWTQRQQSDHFAREAKVKGLKSRAAFKLLEIDAKYRLFRKGQTVVDLGYAPGSWSQVALDRTKPNGRVVGIDILPAQPPKGMSTIQGNFLSPTVQNMVKEYLAEFAHHKVTPQQDAEAAVEDDEIVITERPSYINAERAESIGSDHETNDERLVDVILSDMLMNTSGMSFRDHAGSMDLCLAALQFASDTLRSGGHFVCKFYQGAEDKALELKLKRMFGKVHREKPDSSRNESREGFFVALRRKGSVTLDDVSI
ncbi:23S ribosomal RNA methyltransferase [Nemania sp. FL0916]|nr:23S ribosomal RNA methyltransferase [Nemania sp. FL0916]